MRLLHSRRQERARGRRTRPLFHGIGFDRLTQQADEGRDGYAQIVYRFIYIAALDLGVGLGDPHPGDTSSATTAASRSLTSG